MRVEKGEENEVEIRKLENGGQIDFSFCIKSNILLMLNCAAGSNPLLKFFFFLHFSPSASNLSRVSLSPLLISLAEPRAI